MCCGRERQGESNGKMRRTRDAQNAGKRYGNAKNQSENGDLFLRDDIYIERKTENLVIEFKKQNRIERDWLVRYDKTVQENILKQKQMQDLRRPLCFMAGFGIILLLILTALTEASNMPEPHRAP